jgi:hypothetical protein
MKGFLDHRVVKAVIFYVCMVCLLVSMLSSILSIWGVMDDAALHKALSTLSVIFFGSLLFLGLNLAFGSLTQDVARDGEDMESPFGDRMKRAKDLHGEP